MISNSKQTKSRRIPFLPALIICVTTFVVSSFASAADQAESLEQLRNTVINLLEGLVQKGVLTREQAQTMVQDAQDKAAAQSKAKADQAAAEKDAVRVTYVPEPVRKQIADEVSVQLQPQVTQEVIAQAKQEGWGVPGALPDWIKNVKLYGDVRARAEGNIYASDNVAQSYPNYMVINDKGSFAAAGIDQFLNTTVDRQRLVGRLRFGVQAQLGNDYSLDFRIASGNARSPVSTNQTLGNYDNRWDINVDKAAILWHPINSTHDREFDLRFGRFANPFVTVNELIWDNDLTFEGISATYAMDLFGNDPAKMERGLFLTLGAFPLQEVELSSDDKWLYGGQLGVEFTFGRDTHLRFAGAYYQYDNVTGIYNTILDSQTYDYTAPRFLQKGNLLFNIRNSSTNPTDAQLWALAGEYRLMNGSVWLDMGLGATHVMIGGEYVRNLAWDAEEVAARANLAVIPKERTTGYDLTLIVGHPVLAALGDMRGFFSYRYLQSEAVLDAFTDSDFHLGGTDAKGYQLGFDLGLSRGAWMRIRYLTANEIDGPIDRYGPLGIDVWQLDLNGQF